MSITITDITGVSQCPTDITFNLWCPSPVRFPGQTGCGKLIKSYGVIITEPSTFTDLLSEVNKVKNRQVRCPYCNYRFTPYEVYI